MENDNVGVGGFLSEYTSLLVHSHGQVDEDDIDIDVDGVEECGDIGDAMDVEADDNDQVDAPQKIPIHFEILVKVLFSYSLKPT